METERRYVSGGFCLILALLFLLVPLPWLIAGLVAAAFHELCHYAAIRLLSRSCSSVRLYSYRAYLSVPEMSRGREALCALAGPLGSLCLLSLSSWFPRLALCAAMQFAYNLLPIYPLDGGRILRCVASMVLSPPCTEALCRWIGILAKGLILLVGVYGCFCLKLGIFPLLMAILLWIRVK